MTPHDVRPPIILFDGVCNLCNGAVQFIIKRDKARYFRFASLQGETGRRLLDRHFPDAGSRPDSMMLVEGDSVFTHSDAVLRITRRLGPGWAILSLFRVIPRPIRDFVYRRIAKHRYRLFGKQETCMIPSPDLKHLFVDENY